MKLNSKVHNLVSYGGAFFLYTALIWSEYDKFFPANEAILGSKQSQQQSGEDLAHFETKLAFFIASLWLAHFLKRILEVLFVHQFGKATDLIADALPEYLYYWLFCIWIFYSNSPQISRDGYNHSLLKVGILIWSIGQIGNFWSHLKLRLIKNKNNGKKVIPRGLFFDLVSCPHYFFEILSWLGFALIAQSIASWVFLIAVIGILSLWGSQRHSDYLNTFPTYPKDRKRVIPFLF